MVGHLCDFLSAHLGNVVESDLKKVISSSALETLITECFAGWLSTLRFKLWYQKSTIIKLLCFLSWLSKDLGK